jgi:hypothetical protein
MSMTIEQLEKDIKLLTENLRSMDSIHGSWGVDISTTGTEGDSDHNSVLLLTTGTAGITRTLPSATNNKYRCIKYVKVDSGAGTGAIAGLGGTWATLYLINQGDSLELQSDGSVWRTISGKIQPVATEADIGGGWHVHNYQAYSADVGDTNWHEVSLSGHVSAGCKLAKIFAEVDGTSSYFIKFSDSNAGTVRYKLIIPTANGYGSPQFDIPLSSSLSFWFQGQNAGIGTLTLTECLYCLGPA